MAVEECGKIKGKLIKKNVKVLSVKEHNVEF